MRSFKSSLVTASVLFSIATICCHAPALADEPPAKPKDESGPIVVEGRKDPSKRKVCTREVLTGSIMPKTVCRTVAEIEEQRAAAAQAVETLRRDQAARRNTQSAIENR